MGPEILRDNFALLIPILALMIPIVAIVAYYVSKSNRERQLHETIRELTKAGQPIPPQLLGRMDAEDSDFEPAPRAGSAYGGLRSGVSNLFVGIGLMAFFYVMKPHHWLWAVGLIPFCYGLGRLLVWRFESQASTLPRP